MQPELNRLRSEIGELAHCEEDVLTFAMFPDIGRDFLQQRADGTLEPEVLEPLKHENGLAKMAATEFNVTIHGETYHLKVNGTGYRNQPTRPYYINIDGVPEEILVETLDSMVVNQTGINESTQTNSGHAGARPRATEPGHVTTSMPGSVVDVLVNLGDKVTAGTPVLITEAMKMETEIQAPIAGTFQAVHVKKGDAVTPDQALIEIK